MKIYSVLKINLLQRKYFKKKKNYFISEIHISYKNFTNRIIIFNKRNKKIFKKEFFVKQNTNFI